ncbi:hypothetical protein PHLCEN_2v12285 [Hermanssonia centrifuga]|uniref:Uncharacterized protein n=1 Tax=Hermanssonia centrifuga TaxID=98765 RepID=A0A2R6NHC7_9APHY|nr:hypothetical protein PHLCEN_2v12285 [Hermanssonia centrifuga]
MQNGTLAITREILTSVLMFLGLLCIATGTHSTLLAIPGRQTGHVQLVHLPPCPPPQPIGPPSSTPPAPPPPTPTKHPVSIIAAHTTALTTLTVPPSGKYLATTSSRGTLIRIWDSNTGKLVRELRRGSDKAEIYGVAFRPDEREVCVWSDKGTVHIFSLVGGSGGSNRQSTFSPLTPYIPLPKYFDSEWSYAQYRIPAQSAHISLSAPPTKLPTADDVDEEKCVVGWIEGPADDSGEPNRAAPSEYQLIALTYTGGWYRLSLPASNTPMMPSGSPSPKSQPISISPPSVRQLSMQRPRSPTGSSVVTSRTEKGKGKDRERDKEGKESRDCILREFRRYGRWDGWG